jgi:hypothetical protein
MFLLPAYYFFILDLSVFDHPETYGQATTSGLPEVTNLYFLNKMLVL